MEKYLVCIDLDSTFLKDDKSISDYSKEYIKKFVNEGNYLIINTGRPHQGAIQFLKELDIHQPMIVSNGSAIVEYDQNYENVISHITFTMDQKNVKKFYKKTKKYIKTCAISCLFDFYSTDISSCPFFIIHPSEQVKFHEGDIDKILNQNPLRTEYFVKSEYVNKFEKILNKRRFKKVFDYINWGTWDNIASFEIFPKNGTKGFAMEYLSKKLGISYKNTFAFGDQLNDLSMIEYAHDGVAMLNARDEVKTKANHITKKDNNQDGVVSYLEELNLI